MAKPGVSLPLHDPCLSVEKAAFHRMQFGRCFLFFLLVITKPSLGELILDVVMLLLWGCMEGLDEWDLARHAALSLLLLQGLKSYVF